MVANPSGRAGVSGTLIMVIEEGLQGIRTPGIN